MKTKSSNRVVSLLLALFMLLTCVPLTFMATNTTARAEGNTYVLESKDLTAFAAGAKADGDSEKAGTDKYFTVYYSAKTKIDSNTKDFDDGYHSEQRINSSAAATVGKDSIGFTTSGAATIKLWWVKNSDNDREMVILDSAGNQVDITSEKAAANTLHINTLKVSDAGTYYLGSTNGGNYIFKVEVTESAAASDYVFESKDLTAFAAGAKADGDSEKAGTDGFFTVYYSAKTKVDSNSKEFEDGYTSGQRLNSSAAASVGKDSIGFTVPGEATVKIWWVKNSDNDREMVILDTAGNQVDITSEKAAANTLHINTLKVPAAGTYYLGSTNGGNYIFKVQVTTGGGEIVRTDWKDVAAPVITNAKDDGAGKIVVTVSAVVGAAGGDGVNVIMCDASGKQLDSKNSLREGSEHSLEFAPTATGTYSFKATLNRDGEAGKESAIKNAAFVLPVKVPTMSSVTSKGNGTMEVIWNAVAEATSYNVYRDGTKVGSSNTTTFMDKGLTVGNKYSYTVSAVRGSEPETAQSEAKTGTATKEEQQTWGFCFYGTSTKAANNYAVGDLNTDGKVKVVSNGGSGKFQEGSNDGIAFYYAAIPSNKNFTLRAKIHIDTWTLSSGQEGTGVMALDSLPDPSIINSSGVHWSNSYRAGAQRFAYTVDGIKYQMNIGIGIQNKLGMTPNNIQTVYDVGSAGIINFEEFPLETIAADKDAEKSANVTTSTIGNCTNPETFKNPAADTITDFIIELQRNNTGYFMSYYTVDGKLVNTWKSYEPKALDVLDPDFVYVGFASARNMEATYSDVTLTVIDPKDDKPAEERPITYIDPTVTIKSGDVANSTSYKLLVKANVAGTADVKVGGTTVASGIKLDGSDEYVSKAVTIAAGSNKVEVVFTPDKNAKLPAYTKLSSTDPVTKSVTVNYNNSFADLENIYVAPNGKADGKGTKDSPIDIYTAVKVAGPGQTILLTEGTYKLSEQLKIQRGIDGSFGKEINMFADPDAKTRPVLDFQKKTGMMAVGNYWHFKGFDITKSGDGTPGMYVSGSYCIVERIEAYTNGDCGIYIRSEGNSADPKSLWPKYNHILNCTAYDNADATGENADGFAAKFTVGVGNVFEGCVSHHNCDDGWDLYARGMSIESVLLKNCVAYENGHNLDGSIRGNGNGFKLGGENMAGAHKIVNSVAFNNDSNGITCNSCPDIKIINCTSYNNKGSNVTTYSNATNTNFEVTGVISFKDSKSASQDADSMKGNGTQDMSKINQANNYFWDGSKGANPAGAAITADMFASTEFKGVNRKADGSIDLGDFLKLTDKAPKDAGAREGGDKGYDYNPATGVDYGYIVAIMALAGAAALALFIKKRRA